MVKLIKRKINYGWRVAATGMSFVSFGVGGVVIAGCIAPILKLTAKTPAQREQQAKLVIKYAFKSFVLLVNKLGVMSYHIEGLEKLQSAPQELVIANHPTLIDVVLLLAAMKPAHCVVKQALLDNPFTHGPISSAGYIINAGSEQFIQDCIATLKQDEQSSLLIFPEGTRTAKAEILNDFQRGAANIALRTQLPIRPIVIRCTPSTLSKNEKWYKIPQRAFHIEIKIMDALQLNDLLEDLSVNPRNVRALNRQLQQFFYRELSKTVANE
ncbi:lysophospholipid acyltransferase family protein [Acinetobacter larvae]|uniref:lysophospholipid acyltransferase family protein n=1 Tax=Acinetobacter larvae TaxID=1789224 RepID=UPI001E510014|nr:lysophospholipid acyltransferase family protein [Acinetobacter larvae]